jgi:hypothetical protein
MDGLGSPSYRPYPITNSLNQQPVTRRVTIAWHERARESMGETPMPLSNTPSHNPLKQQAVTRRVGIKSAAFETRAKGARFLG